MFVMFIMLYKQKGISAGVLIALPAFKLACYNDKIRKIRYRFILLLDFSQTRVLLNLFK